MLSNLSKNILKIAAFFFVGAAGGIFAEQVLWPYFVERPLFFQYSLEERPVQINKTEEIIIEENVALERAIEKVEKAVVGIRAKKKTGKFLEGSGLIVTSDGSIITLAELVPEGLTPDLYIKQGNSSFHKVSAKVLKRDLKNNLAMIQVEDKADLSATGFVDLDKKKLGERVFLIGVEFIGEESLRPALFVNQGIISSFSADLIQTNIFESNNVSGSPLFDIEGNLVGLNTIDSNYRVVSISVDTIKDFLGF